MKKLILCVAFLYSGLSNVNAQESNLSIGGHIGVPIGDLSNAYNFNLGFDVSYYWRINGILKTGITTGFSNYFGKNIKNSTFFDDDDNSPVEIRMKDRQIIPVAGIVKFNVANELFIGGDVGYAFFLGDSDDTGAFYYQPKVGYEIKQKEIYLAYKAMTKDGDTIRSINLGFAYNF